MPIDREGEIEHYARGLLELSLATGRLPQVEAELARAVSTIRESEELLRFLASSDVTPEGKADSILRIFDGRISPELRYFIGALAHTGGIRRIEAIDAEFRRQASLLEQRASGAVVSAIPLSSDKLHEIEEVVSAYMGRPVRLLPHVDRNLLGGIRVEVGNVVIDHTVDRHLEDARRALLA